MMQPIKVLDLKLYCLLYIFTSKLGLGIPLADWNIKDVKMPKRLFQPAYGIQSTCSLVKTHNSPNCISQWSWSLFQFDAVNLKGIMGQLCFKMLDFDMMSFGPMKIKFTKVWLGGRLLRWIHLHFRFWS